MVSTGMTLIAALNFPEGISKSKNTAIMKLILLTALAAVALAEPEADAYYGYGGYYGHGLYGYGYGHQLGWPSYRAPGFESTVWGARGKRSAEPSAEPHGYGFYGYHPYAYGLYHPYAYGYHVAAPAVAAPAPVADLPAATAGVGGHPGGATSYSHRSPQGLRGKRSANDTEAVAESAVVPLGYYPYTYDQLHWPAVYGAGYSSQCWSCRGKRSADPAPGVSPYFPGNIKMEDINYGKTQIKYLSKRSAEADTEAVPEEAPAAAANVAVAYPYFGYYGHQLGWPSYRAPGFSSTVWGARGKRSAEAEPGYGYGYGYYGYPAYRGYYGHPYLGAGVAGHPTGTSYSHRSIQGLGK